MSADLPNNHHSVNSGNRRGQNSNISKPSSSYFEHPNRRNLLTGQHIMAKKGIERKGGNFIDISPNMLPEKQMATHPLSPTRQMMVTTVETAQQQFGNKDLIGGGS